MNDMRVQRVEPIRHQVARMIRAAITDLRFKPGSMLIERELCELTGASRPSVREALRQLESEGLVVSITGKGTVVASVTEAEAKQLYQVRAVLEGLAGRLFTLHASPEQHRELAAVVDRFEAEIEEQGNLLAVKDDFYRVLFDGAGNEVAHQMLASLQRRTSLLRSKSLSASGRPRQTLRELRAILAKAELGEAEAVERLCREHVAEAERAALARLAEPEGGQPGPSRHTS
ncbi:GntR family transcriptional regulator [Streptomyces sp. NPDC004838]